jgi:hypothetical protein
MFRNLSFAFVIAALTLGAPSFAHARSGIGIVSSCEGGIDSISNLVEPVRPFANGDIKVAHISVEEPESTPDSLLIFMRSKNDPVNDCFAVSAT